MGMGVSICSRWRVLQGAELVCLLCGRGWFTQVPGYLCSGLRAQSQVSAQWAFSVCPGGSVVCYWLL